MLKIAVFDGGWGGENVADYLATELNIIEVIRIIDWANAPYHNKTLAEICMLAENNLASFINKVDVIVLGGYVVSMALEYLSQRYPKQKFISVGVDRDYLSESKHAPHRVTVFMNHLLLHSEFHQLICQHFPHSEVLAPNCSDEEAMIDLGECGTPNLCRKLDRGHMGSEIIILLNTHFWHLQCELEESTSWRTAVVDFRKKLLRDLCTSLKLRGVDGGRPI